MQRFSVTIIIELYILTGNTNTAITADRVMPVQIADELQSDIISR